MGNPSSKTSVNIFEWRDRVFDDDRIPGAALATAYLISKLYDATKGYAYPGIGYMQDFLGAGEKTIRNHIDALVGAGYLTKQRQGERGGNHYRLVIPPKTHSRKDRVDAARSVKSDASDDGEGGVSSVKLTGTEKGQIGKIGPLSPVKLTVQSGKIDRTTSSSTSSKTSLKGAAHQAPATSLEDTPPLPPITEPAAPRAPEGLGAASTDGVDPDLIEIIEQAERDAYDNPSLMRPEYSPPPMERAEAARFLTKRPRSAWYRQRAAILRRLARTAGSDPDLGSRAAHALDVLLNHAKLIDFAAMAATAADPNAQGQRPKAQRPHPSRVHEDEVPF